MHYSSHLEITTQMAYNPLFIVCLGYLVRSKIESKDRREKGSVKIQSSVLVHLGFGKYVRSDNVVAMIPVEQERGPGRRTLVYLQGQSEPLVVSRAEDTIVRDLVQEPREVTQARQQQEILRDLLQSLEKVNATVRRISRDEGGLDLDQLENRITKVLED
jgi:hypothetical protein